MSNDGKYYDGVTPVSIAVKCTVIDEGLLITKVQNDVPVAVWLKEDIFLDENHNTAFVIGNKTTKGRVELSNPEVAKNLGFDDETLVQSHYALIFKWFALLTFVVAAFWLSIPFLTKTIASKIPYRYEKEYSSKMTFEKSFELCKLSNEEEQALKTYVDFLYPKNKAETEMPVKFRMVKGSTVNALTFPGGNIIIYSGLLKEMKTPEEFLGVMAHELGHVVARDSMSFLVRGTLIASLFGYLTGDFNTTFAVSPQILLSTAALSFDREMEKKADHYAQNRLMENKIGTSGLKSFFSRKGNDDSYAVPEMLMTHPSYSSRIKEIAEYYPKEDLPKEIKDNWDILKKACQ